jgi:hypothetical protein
MKQVSSDILLICSDKYDDENRCPVIRRAEWPYKVLKKKKKVGEQRN